MEDYIINKYIRETCSCAPEEAKRRLERDRKKNKEDTDIKMNGPRYLGCCQRTDTKDWRAE